MAFLTLPRASAPDLRSPRSLLMVILITFIFYCLFVFINASSKNMTEADLHFFICGFFCVLLFYLFGFLLLLIFVCWLTCLFGLGFEFPLHFIIVLGFPMCEVELRLRQ